MHLLRALIATTFAVLLGAAGVALTPQTAHAEDIYRYWSYFTVEDGAFVAAQTGPVDATPADGAVEGYRYAAPADFTNPNLPRADLKTVTFDSVCADVDAAGGEKRVAVVLDYGVEQDAPDSASIPEPVALCAVVPTDANGLQVLQSVAPKVRTEQGSFGPMLCGINDYPATGCADEIAESGTPADEPVEFVIGDDAAAAADAGADSEADAGSNVPLLVVAGLVGALVAVGGLYLSRRRQA